MSAKSTDCIEDFSSSVMPIGRRGSRRAKEKLRIEKAAVELFLGRGPSEVTAEDIATAADISRRTFFRYFPSRDDVLAAGHTRAMQRVFVALRERPLNESLIESMVSATRHAQSHSGQSREEVELVELSQRLLIKHPEVWTRVITQARDTIEKGLADAVAFRFCAAGKNADEAPVIAAALWSISCFVFYEWLKSEGQTAIPDRLSEMLQALGHALTDRP